MNWPEMTHRRHQFEVKIPYGVDEIREAWFTAHLRRSDQWKFSHPQARYHVGEPGEEVALRVQVSAGQDRSRDMSGAPAFAGRPFASITAYFSDRAGTRHRGGTGSARRGEYRLAGARSNSATMAGRADGFPAGHLLARWAWPEVRDPRTRKPYGTTGAAIAQG